MIASAISTAQGLRQGQESAIREIQAEFGPMIAATATRRGLDPDDVMQEVLWRLWDKRELYDPERPLAHWVTSIARNVMYDMLRRRKRAPKSVNLESMEIHPEIACEDEVEVHDEEVWSLGLVERMLKMLAPAQRRVAVMSASGRSDAEIAADLEVEESTVRTIRSGAYARMRSIYRNEYVPEEDPQRRLF